MQPAGGGLDVHAYHACGKRLLEELPVWPWHPFSTVRYPADHGATHDLDLPLEGKGSSLDNTWVAFRLPTATCQLWRKERLKHLCGITPSHGGGENPAYLNTDSLLTHIQFLLLLPLLCNSIRSDLPHDIPTMP